MPNQQQVTGMFFISGKTNSLPLHFSDCVIIQAQFNN